MALCPSAEADSLQMRRVVGLSTGGTEACVRLSNGVSRRPSASHPPRGRFVLLSV